MGQRWEPVLEAVVRERYAGLVAYAHLLSGSRADAEDLVQDALIRTFSRRPTFESLAEAESYLRKVVSTRFIDRVRSRRAERSAVARLAARPAAEPVAGPIGIEPEVEAALADLGPRERTCVLLRHVEDLSVRQTAQVLRLSEGAVKRYTSDGLAALAAALGAEVGERAPVVTDEEVGRRA